MKRCWRRSSAASARCSARLLGALMVRTLGEAAKQFTGDVPGLDLVVYGVVLILVIAFAPRGVAGIMAQLRGWLMPPAKKTREAPHG